MERDVVDWAGIIAWSKIAAFIAVVLAIWRASAVWTRMSGRVDTMWDEHQAVGKYGLKQRGVIVENSPISLGETVSEALAKGIPPDLLEFFLERSKKKLPKHDADVWALFPMKFGMARMVERAFELEWSMDEYKVWCIAALRNPKLVKDAMRLSGLAVPE